ncbi:metal ABC transporter substrate-binding protein [Halalkalicoccus ordinarius]|uniref:metal ABC transporter substrate-binding protein n=1 Tax=Halalkalicoccus ordinarius TaxID=3116651 RepID=UPI00300ED5C6
MNETRRELLRLGAGAIAAAGVAGCTGSLGSGASDAGGEESEGTSATASFFTLYDFVRNVGGDAFAVENAVPAGQHGHGWEPQSDITADVVERDAFVHLGIEGFQRWADEIVAEIEANHDDVTLIPVAEGIELSEYGDRGHESDHHDGEEDGNHDGDEEHGHDDHEHGGEGDHQEEDGRDHGDYDPHLWVDPVRARQAVENVRGGLVEADEENAETYEENAAAYLDELEALDRRFEEELAGRERDVVVVAGHDSYGYLAERYDFEIHTPQGVSPDAEASPGDIAETVDLVEREGIEYVLYDHFEGDTLARTIVEEAETATDVARLSPAESVTEEWEAEGLDYVGQMEEINLPSLRRALGAE